MILMSSGRRDTEYETVDSKVVYIISVLFQYASAKKPFGFEKPSEIIEPSLQSLPIARFDFKTSLMCGNFWHLNSSANKVASLCNA